MATLAHTGSDAAWASQRVLKSVSALESPPLTVAVVRRKTSGLPDLILASPQLIVLGEDIQDPANVGAVIRTCAAAGFPALVLCGASADFYNPKVVRSAAGAILRCLLARHPDAAEVITILRRAGYRIIATVNAGGVDYLDVSMLAPTALLFGNEGKGLKESTLALADVKLHIPLSPGVDSLNVAACCAILLYEALRQRRSPPS
jgi:TrmH family RNA methyltransferase